MIEARRFIQAAKDAGFGIYSGVPCSYLQPFINYVIDSSDLQYVGAANEGDAVAIAAGACLAGVGGVAMFQNSGLGNAINPLTSLNLVAHIPILVITTVRGHPEDPPDEPQHSVMGHITGKLFDAMGIPWAMFPDHEPIEPALNLAVETMEERRKPYALLMRKGAVAAHALQSRAAVRPPGEQRGAAQPWPGRRHSRADYLLAVQSCVGPRDVVIATTGYTGRELYALDDRANQLYVVGSMGCASSLALGLALAKPATRVVVIDGDGAMLMRLGALATIGYERPANLIHVLFDNEAHESTGAQSTTSHSVDLGEVARACGYPTVARVGDPAALADAIRSAQGLTFLHAKTALGALKDLPRPKMPPSQVVERLRAHLSSEGAR